MSLKIEEKVEEKVKGKIIQNGFEIEYIEFVKEGDNNFLRIVLDKPESIVTIEDCENISRLVEDDIDEMISKEYILEVSSPGVERQLKNIQLYSKYVGQQIFVKLYKKLEFGKEIQCLLNSVDVENNTINITFEENNVNINIKDIASSHTIYDFAGVLKGNKKINMNKLNKFNKK